MIGHIDVAQGFIASCSKDSTVRLWDIQKKRAVTFDGCHMNAVKKVILWN